MGGRHHGNMKRPSKILIASALSAHGAVELDLPH
jgi:hypothetical protein